jgi:hypothetical protein
MLDPWLPQGRQCARIHPGEFDRSLVPMKVILRSCDVGRFIGSNTSVCLVTVLRSPDDSRRTSRVVLMSFNLLARADVELVEAELDEPVRVPVAGEPVTDVRLVIPPDEVVFLDAPRTVQVAALRGLHPRYRRN